MSGDHQAMTEKKPNALVHESSPYLLQHAYNPVDWHPWGPAALQKAKTENKPLLISIGYAACHWCHVMEHESFEDSAVADLMNRFFVPIKVDREERPDVDQVYMDAAQLLTGRGGWPLNAFTLPDGQPFYAGTYFPKAQWLKLLEQIAELYEHQHQALVDQAQKVTKGIEQQERVVLQPLQGLEEGEKEKPIVHLDELETTFTTWQPRIDLERGGENRAPKFPMPTLWTFLLHYQHLSGDEAALSAVTTTLDHMAMGGIYDQVGGGFARYSTDVDWLVPHFEKMLYDNAQLVSLYTAAWQQSKNPHYKATVVQTLAFVEREMTAPDGSYYASLDADSEGEEGKFYVWTAAEIDAVLGDKGHADLLKGFYQVSQQGNWEEGKNILHCKQSLADFAKARGLLAEEVETHIEEGKKALLQARALRTRPGLDDKVLCSWNALMLQAYANAYRAFGTQAYLKTALRNAHFLLDHMIAPDGAMMRNYKEGKASIPAFLDDYAFVISAFVTLYQATFEERWLIKARQLADYVLVHFDDPTSGMFFYAHADHAKLIVRKMELTDNVIPASNSEMAKNLWTLGQYFDDKPYQQRARQMLVNMKQQLLGNLYFYANWGQLAMLMAAPPREVAILGKKYQVMRAGLEQHYLPGVLLLGGTMEGSLPLLQRKLVKGQTTVYVCQEKTCQLPVMRWQEALQQLREN